MRCDAKQCDSFLSGAHKAMTVEKFRYANVLRFHKRHFWKCAVSISFVDLTLCETGLLNRRGNVKIIMMMMMVMMIEEDKQIFRCLLEKERENIRTKYTMLTGANR